ncbi:hypothetical protein D3C87_1772270 [compost metagenome]
MKLHPFHDLLFIAALGRQVQVVVGADQQVEAAGVGGVGMEDFAVVVAIKHAQAGEFFFAAVGFFVVVGRLAGGDVFGPGGNTEVVIEIAAC